MSRYHAIFLAVPRDPTVPQRFSASSHRSEGATGDVPEAPRGIGALRFRGPGRGFPAGRRENLGQGTLGDRERTVLLAPGEKDAGGFVPWVRFSQRHARVPCPGPAFRDARLGIRATVGIIATLERPTSSSSLRCGKTTACREEPSISRTSLPGGQSPAPRTRPPPTFRREVPRSALLDGTSGAATDRVRMSATPARRLPCRAGSTCRAWRSARRGCRAR